MRWSSLTTRQATTVAVVGAAGLAYVASKVFASKYDIRGKTVLVTGGGSGIGKILCRRLASLGCKVIIWDVQQELSEATTAEINSSWPGSTVFYKVDLSNRVDVERVAAQTNADFDFVEVVVNNAGIATGKPLLEASPQQIERTFAVNTLAHFWVVRAFLPKMIERNAGYIVTVASIAGHFGVAKLVDYCSSKFAAVGFDESLRLEIKRLGKDIHTTCVCPYYIKTGMFEGVSESCMMGLLRPLEPEYVVDRMLQAIQAKEAVLMMPSIVKIAPWMRALFSARTNDSLSEMFGMNSSMDHFKQTRKTNQ
eukprot:c33613_g1_i1.p1 GENE.c33613_g1_i1~~c33613_g1_i1.p1  ORF type:complete len:309 (+),score=73.37 c33613_g1_i1:45-971(+)